MATGYATAAYTEVIDLQTIADKVSIVGIHTPRGKSPYNRLKGFFQQFRKFKYDGISSLVMVPAANLPVDPLGLTGVVGTTDLMDPRDMLNPILFHGCHGENLTEVLNQIYAKVDYVDGNGDVVKYQSGNDLVDVAPSADIFHNNMTDANLFDVNNYYAKLTDKSWRKFGIQSGVKLKSMRPLVHKMVRNTPLLPGFGALYADAALGSRQGLLGANSSAAPNRIDWVDTADSGNAVVSAFGEDVGSVNVPDSQSSSTGFYVKGLDNEMFTAGLTKLGWLPTSVVTPAGSAITLLPKLFMGILVLPPAYNVEQFFRMVITHHFSFKDFTSSLSLMDPALASDVVNGDGVPYTNWIDYGTTLDSVGAKSEVVSDGVA